MRVRVWWSKGGGGGGVEGGGNPGERGGKSTGFPSWLEQFATRIQEYKVPNERAIFMLYLLYWPTEISFKAQRELQILRKLQKLQKIAIFVRFVVKRILAKFVAERLNKNCEFLQKLRLRKIAILVRFLAKRILAKFVA